MGRITSLLKMELACRFGRHDFNATNDRAMVCGSIDLNSDMKRILENYGLREGANSDPGDYVIEKAFVG